MSGRGNYYEVRSCLHGHYVVDHYYEPGYVIADSVNVTRPRALSQFYADLGDAVALQTWLRERAAGYPPSPRLSFDPSVGTVTEVSK